MNRTATIWKSAALSVGVLALGLAAQAQVNTNPSPNLTISWDFDSWGFSNAGYGTGVPVPNTAAGLVLATNWNDGWSENGSATAPGGSPVLVTNLFDITGVGSGVALRYNGFNGASVVAAHKGPDADGSNNREMINGYLNTGPAAWGPAITNSFVSVSNITYATYDVVVYFNSDNAGRHGSIDNGTNTYYFSTVGGPSVSGVNALLEPTTQTNSTLFPPANFAFFPGMTSSVATFTEKPKSGNDQWLGICGFQLIQCSNTYVLYGASPATQIVPVGQPAAFSVMAGGLNPKYQWRHNGTAIANATNAAYSIGATASGQDGSYDVVVANSFSSSTSSVATLTFYTPKTLEWDGNNSVWDTTTTDWTANGGTSTIAYTETDNVRFGPLGSAQSTVTLSGTFTPSSITVSNSAYTFSSGALAGSGSLHLKNNATFILDTIDTRTGPTVIDNGSTFQLDNGDTAGGMGAGALTNNGTLLFDAAGDEGYAYPIYGTGSITNAGSSGQITLGSSVNAKYLVQTGTGSLLLQGSNSLSGGLVVSGGTVLARGAYVLGNAPVVVAGGELQLVYNFDFVVPATTLAGGLLHGGISGDATLEGPVILATSSEIDVNSGASLTLNGGISGAYGLTLGGTGGTLVLTSSTNAYPSLTINAGTVAFNSAANLTLTNLIGGAGNLSQTGSGTTLVLGDLTGLTGVTTVSAGTLGGSFTNGGPVSVLPGATLAPGTPSAIGTVAINSDLTLGGNVTAKVNPSLAQPNDLITVSGALSNTNNGLVNVKNLGSALAVGAKFTLFSQPVSGGDTLTVWGAGVIWANNLATDGSISVQSTTVPRPVISSAVASASTLVFAGSNAYPGSPYTVLGTTNLTAPWTVITTGYFDAAGTCSVTNPITPGVPQLFYRLEQ